jgi:hypothetical protein
MAEDVQGRVCFTPSSLDNDFVHDGFMARPNWDMNAATDGE